MTKPNTELAAGFWPAISGIVRLTGFLSLLLLLPVAYCVVHYTTPDKWGERLCSFYKLLLSVLGFKVRVHGTPSPHTPTLFVSNHTSYLDVAVLGSIIPASFVAKSEVASWPLIGWLAKLQNTAFVERRSAKAAEQRDKLQPRLQNKQGLIFFPEGTSTEGLGILPFKSTLFSLAEPSLPEGGPIPVQPVSIVCTEMNNMPIGRTWRPYYAWYGDMTFVPHLWNALKFGRFTVDVIFHDVTSIAAFGNRKGLALHCETEVRKGVEVCLGGRFEPTIGEPPVA